MSNGRLLHWPGRAMAGRQSTNRLFVCLFLFLILNRTSSSFQMAVTFGKKKQKGMHREEFITDGNKRLAGEAGANTSWSSSSHHIESFL